MAVAVATEMAKLDKYADVDMSVVTAALLIHDSFKSESGTDHPQIAAEAFRDFASNVGYEDDNDWVERVCACVYMHMGQWTNADALKNAPDSISGQSDAEVELVHLSDFIAGRPFFDLGVRLKERKDIIEEM